jgi:hypothetical protein
LPDVGRLENYEGQLNFTPPPYDPPTPKAKAPDEEAETAGSGTPPTFDPLAYGQLPNHPNAETLGTGGVIKGPDGESGRVLSKNRGCLAVAWERAAERAASAPPNLC